MGSKAKKISREKTAISNSKNKVPKNATELKQIPYDNMKTHISFLYVDRTKWKLSEWQGSQLDSLINCFEKIESMKWPEIIKHKGLRYKALDNPPDVNNELISPDVKICEMRVSNVERIHGFRDQNVFCVVWFDRAHSVCPEGKNRKHG